MKEEKILFWDFQTRLEGNRIFMTLIPISYEGGITVEELEKILNSTDDSVYPIFSGDGKVIYCCCPLLAIKLYRKGHKFLPEEAKEFEIKL